MKASIKGYCPYIKAVCHALDNLGITYKNNTFMSDMDHDFEILTCDREHHTTSFKPAIILSSSSVYSCLDSSLKVKEVPFTEDQALVIPNPISCFSQVRAIKNESYNARAYRNNMVLRVCNPYGGDFVGSIIDDLINHFRTEKSYVIDHSAYRKKSYIYYEDLVEVLTRSIKLFCEGLRGYYNIGGNDVINMENVVDTVYGSIYKTSPTSITVREINRFCNFYEVVDITRIQAITGWEPKYSVRKGIWETVTKKVLANPAKLSPKT